MMMVSWFNWSSVVVFFWVLINKVSSFKKLVSGGHWAHPSLSALVAIGWLISFILASGYSFLYLFPASHSVVQNDGHPQPANASSSSTQCDVFEGNWVEDESYPMYNASDCPFVESGFNCVANGRKDKGYLRWRWKPKNCEIPRFNARVMLERLRDKRVVFVGDSLSRTQWESMICMLVTGVEDKRSVYEVNGNKITKRIRFLGVRFSSFNFTVEFYRSVFLVRPGNVPRKAPKRVKSSLKLDKMDDISELWTNSDVLVFNSGHWWTPSKLFEMGCYFQLGGSLKLGMSITTAFRTALNTWASWAERRLNANRTHVFFRTFESSHWSRRACKVTRRPLRTTKGKEKSQISDAIVKVVKNMTVPVTVLHVTSMGAFRSDAHVGTWSENPEVPDCSHWCLPGLPDMWNEVLFSYLLSDNRISLT